MDLYVVVFSLFRGYLKLLSQDLFDFNGFIKAMFTDGTIIFSSTMLVRGLKYCILPDLN